MIEKKYLKDVAYEKIKEMIILGELIGPVITEKQLVDLLGISRTPIREALQRLANNDRLIDVLPKRGIIIRELTVKETKDIMDVRLAIELFSAEKLEALITEEKLETLNEIVYEQEKVVEEKNAFEFIKLDLKYHRAFVGIYDNDYFDTIINTMTDRLFYHGMKVFPNKFNRVKSSLNDHRIINTHLGNMEFKLALEQMRIHIERGKTTYLS